MTARHTFFKAMYGKILHVTHLQGLRGIMDSGFIVPNRDGTRGYSVLGSTPGCYVCQKQDGVSILDLKNAAEKTLVECYPFQNWLGIFTEHKPGIALELIPYLVESNLKRFSREELLEIGGRYIIEAEACHPGPIPVSFIKRAYVIGKNYRVVSDELDLEAAYKRALQVRKFSRHHRKYDIIDISIM